MTNNIEIVDSEVPLRGTLIETLYITKLRTSSRFNVGSFQIPSGPNTVPAARLMLLNLPEHFVVAWCY